MAKRARANGAKVPQPALIADELETKLLGRFTAHPVFENLERLEHDDFLELLLQRRFLSLLFPVIYDIAIDGLTDAAAVTLVREILREEYPDASGRTPSHRENLVCDLLTLGATKPRILASRPTPVTTSVIQETLTVMLDTGQARSDVEVLTTLRFWGEVLVSVEYGEYWRRMEMLFRAAGKPSRFYHPHHHHDGREPLAAASQAAQTHSARLSACLAPLLRTREDAEQLARTEQKVLGLRTRFYDQFAAPERRT